MNKHITTNLTVEERKKKILLQYIEKIRHVWLESHGHHSAMQHYFHNNLGNLKFIIKGLKTYTPKKKQLIIEYLNVYVKLKDKDQLDELYSKIESILRDMEYKFLKQLTTKK